MKEGQSCIYYLIAPSRELALASPYYEGYRDKGVEVLFFYTALDDFVVAALEAFRSTPMQSIESGDTVDLGNKDEDGQSADADGKAAADAGRVQLSEEQASELCTWLRDTLPQRLSTVRTTTRLSSTPAIVVDHQSATFRRMMAAVDPENTKGALNQPQSLEINPAHAIIRRLYELREQDTELATDVAEQLVDNALVAAGLLDDARSCLPRLNRLIERAMEK